MVQGRYFPITKETFSGASVRWLIKEKNGQTVVPLSRHLSQSCYISCYFHYSSRLIFFEIFLISSTRHSNVSPAYVMYKIDPYLSDLERHCGWETNGRAHRGLATSLWRRTEINAGLSQIVHLIYCTTCSTTAIEYA